MNYQKIYDAIIQKAKSKNRVKLRKNQNGYIYYENHHIIPKCLSGTDDKENLVLLTAREHFVCHKLLTYIYKGNRRIVNAFYMLTHTKKFNKKISSRDYAYAKELVINTPILETTRYRHSINSSFRRPEVIEKIRQKTTGRILSEKTKENISTAKKNKHLKHTQETKQKIKISLTGRKDSIEIKQRKRKPHKKMSEETKERMRKSKSLETKLRMSQS